MRHDFDFAKPGSLREALDLISEGNPATRPLAGGTDIIAGLQQNAPRFTGVQKLVDIHNLPELKTIREAGNGISIGGAATFSEIRNHPLIREKFPLLAKAAGSIGSVQIRNRATLAGNFVNNAPCADSVPPLLVYEAEIKIQSAHGERKIPLQDFLLKPYRTQLQPNELVTEILLPRPPAGYSGDFYKLGRRRGVAVSRITLALLAKVRNDLLEDIRISSGAVTPIGLRFRELEALARGKPVLPDHLKEIARNLGERVLDKTGLRWSTPYKLPVTQQTFYGLLHKICIK